MRYDLFTAPTGTFVPTLNGARAFVPEPLPPRLDLAAIAEPLGDARAALGELRGACRLLPNPMILIRPLQRREALTSSAMEGTYTTDDELVLAEAGLDDKPSDDTREVANFIIALQDAIARTQSEPITNRLLKDTHRILMSGMSRHRGGHRLPGEFKAEQNMIGGTTLQTARYIPPPPRETLDCMSQLEAFINRVETLHPNDALMDLAFVHYQFEAIHPFADGNGRVGRMLISLMAVRSGLLDSPALYLSPVIERQKDTYIDAMLAVSAAGARQQWVAFFLSCVTASCQQTIIAINRLRELEADYMQRIQLIRSGNTATIIKMLFESPAVTPKQIVQRIGITDVAARKLLDKMVELGIVTEYKGIYPKAYLAEGILAAARS